MSTSHAPPQTADEALSTLLWQPYECRSPPLARSLTDGALSGGRLRQSPGGGRHARASTLRREMRLPVPAPAPLRKSDSVSVRVPGEPSVSSVHIVPENSNNNNVVNAECQTEEPPARRRRARRGRPARCVPPGAPVLGDVPDPSLPPPPYSTLPPPPALLAGPPPPIVAPPPPPVHRFPFQPVPLRSGRGAAAYACSENEGSAPKSCCGRPPLRLCVLFLGVIGACLVAAGAVLGALRPHPRAPLTLLLLMIGIGVVLVTAAGLAWRLGARDAPCAFLGLRRASCRRFVPRLPPSYARPHHPYAAMLYPEFHYRPPPPTYQASMQEYRLRLLLLDRSVNAVSPPPTYRSNSASLVRGAGAAGWCNSEYNGPPSYRAPRVETAVTVSDALPTLTQLDLKYVDTLESLPKPTESEKDPDEHLVTIVQTDSQPVIVTVSGGLNDSIHQQQPTSEIDILAHL